MCVLVTDLSCKVHTASRSNFRYLKGQVFFVVFFKVLLVLYFFCGENCKPTFLIQPFQSSMLLEVWMTSSCWSHLIEVYSLFSYNYSVQLKEEHRLKTPSKENRLAVKQRAVCVWTFFSGLSMHSAPQGYGKGVSSVTHLEYILCLILELTFLTLKLSLHLDGKTFLLAFTLFLYPILAQERISRKTVL